MGWNCVSYVREKVELPLGLWTLSDKKKIINSYEPTKNAVVITPEAGVGHLAIVKEILDDFIIIEEGNYIHGYKTIRKISKELPIGYYKD